jgi:hypothetical protein
MLRVNKSVYTTVRRSRSRCLIRTAKLLAVCPDAVPGSILAFGKGFDGTQVVLGNGIMRYDRTLRFGLPLMAACAVLFVYCEAAHGQDTQAAQDQSVADAARQARAAKKNAAAKPAKVISDDDIDNKNIKPGAEGLNVGSPPASDAVPPAPAAVAAVEAADAATAAAEKNPPVTPGESPAIARAKERVLEVQKELDLLQRGFSLDSDSYYSKPGFQDDKDGKAKLDAEQQRIGDKQQELDRVKAHLAELQEAWNAKKHPGAENNSSPESEKPAEASAPAPPQS